MEHCILIRLFGYDFIVQTRKCKKKSNNSAWSNTVFKNLVLRTLETIRIRFLQKKVFKKISCLCTFKGTVPWDFRLLFFFSCISFPQAPEYTIRAISNFFENSRRYPQIFKKVGTILMGYLGARGTLIHEKNWSKKSRVRLPLRKILLEEGNRHR